MKLAKEQTKFTQSLGGEGNVVRDVVIVEVKLAKEQITAIQITGVGITVRNAVTV